MKNYPALTIKQPWASLIMNGIKNVENRSWITEYRGPMFIHAGMKWDSSPWPDDPSITTLGDEELMTLTEDNLLIPRGMILGTVDLVMIIDDSMSPWARKGDHHWLISNPRRFAAPVPWRGQMGLWWPVKS